MKISHMMSTLKILTDLCVIKHFCKHFLQCFSSERVFIKHRKNYLKIMANKL